ncbi:MAG: hypothetical protein WC222_08515 [Parachlamydiales bacterium]|jgi:hypothetical protein
MMAPRTPQNVKIEFDKEDYFSQVNFSYPAQGEDGPKELTLNAEQLQDIWDQLWEEGNEEVPEDDIVAFLEYLGTVDYEDLVGYIQK